MNESTVIRLIKQLDVTDLSGEKVMIDFSTGKYFLLKGSANDIWDILVAAKDSPVSIGDVKAKLLEIYDVDADVCLASIISFFEQMKKNEFIEIM